MSSAAWAVLLAAVVGLVAVPDPGGPLRRLAAGHVSRAEKRARRRAPTLPAAVTGRAVRAGPWAAGALAGLTLLAGRGLFAVVVVCAAAVLLGPTVRATRARRQAEEGLRRELPGVLDLLAACLTAGAAPADALDAVCAAVDGPSSSALRPVASALRLGVDPDAAWGRLEATAPLRPLARAMARAAVTGAPTASVLTALAAEERERTRAAAEAAARRVGVRAVGPLGVCFLPAFVLLGVVPVVVAVARQVLAGVG